MNTVETLSFTTLQKLYNMEDSEEYFLEKINNDKIAEYVGAIVFSAFVVVFGIFGNILSVIFYGFKAKRTVTNSFIVSLAVTDLITCVVLSDEIIELSFTVTFKSVFGCKLMYFCNHTLVTSSGLQLGLIAVDRYRRICKPFARQFTQFSAKVGIASVVFVALLVSARDWYILDVVRVEIMSPKHNVTVNAYYCTHSNENGAMQVVIKFFHLIDLTILIVLILCFIVLYGLLAKAIWAAQRRAKRRYGAHKNKKDAKSDLESTDNPSSSGKQATETFSMSESKEGEGKPHSKSVDSKPENNDTNPEKKGKQSRHYHNIRGEKKITIMMMAVTLASMISFIPYFIANLMIKAGTQTSEQELTVGIQIALRSYMLNNAVNPYLMCIFNREFKSFVRRLLCRCYK